MPRHDLKAYKTVLARLPQELADQVKQYASQHRCSVSELIRDGLEMRLEAGDVPGRSTGSMDHGEEVLHEVIHTLSPMLLAQMQDMIRTTVTEVLQGHTSLPQPHTHGMPTVLPLETPSPAPIGKGHTEVLPMVPTTQLHAEGITEVLPMVPTISEPSEVFHDGIPPIPPTEQEGITEGIPNTLRGTAEVVPVKTPAAASTVEGMTEVLQEVMPPLPSTDYEGVTAIIQTITQLVPEVVPGDTSTLHPHAPSTEEGITEVLHHPDAPRPATGGTGRTRRARHKAAQRQEG